MAIFRVEKNQNYTTMSNYHLRDKRLSLKSKGLLSLILSLPEEWDYSVRGLAAICKESPDGIASALRELEKFGYLYREQIRGSNGRLGKVEYVIYEEPPACHALSEEPCTEKPCTEKPCTEKPDTVKPDTVKPDTEKPCMEIPPQINKEISITDQKIKERNKYQSNQSKAERNADADRMCLMRELFIDLIRRKINYEILCQDKQISAKEVDELIQLMADTVCTDEPFIRVAGQNMPTSVVRDRFLQLEMDHVLYVLECLKGNTTKVRNIRQYLITMLFNAPTTMNHYYTAEVGHDFNGT